MLEGLGLNGVKHLVLDPSRVQLVRSLSSVGSMGEVHEGLLDGTLKVGEADMGLLDGTLKVGEADMDDVHEGLLSTFE